MKVKVKVKVKVKARARAKAAWAWAATATDSIRAESAARRPMKVAEPTSRNLGTKPARRYPASESR